MKNYYKILGIRAAATDAEIKQAYRRLAKVLHPDLNRDNPKAADQIANINEAYEILSDSEKRAKYNKELNNTATQSAAGYGNTRSGFSAATERPQPHPQYASYDAVSQRTQIDNAIKQAYNEGYSKGFNDCKYKVDAESVRNANQITELRKRVADLEKEIVYFEKDYEKQAEKLAEANSKIESMEKQEDEDNDEDDIEKLKLEINVAKMQADRAKQKLSGVIDAVEQRDRTIEYLNTQISDLKDRIAQLEEYSFIRERDDDIGFIVEERARRLKQIKKQIKDTHYGTLGAMYWVDQEEIKNIHEKFAGRLRHKADGGDETSKKKLAELEEAYAVLSDKKKREEYNLSLDIAQEDIDREIQLETDYFNILEKYNADKEEQEFWQYFDELMMQAQGGDAEAQNELGELYYDSERMVQDIGQAVHWFRESAKHQNPAGLYNLGLCHYYGDGVELDKIKGEGFLKMAAKLGNKEAISFLSSIEK